MKKKTFLLPFLVTTFSFLILPIYAHHLDGLWRSDRRQLTVRIEQDQNGFRAKRTDRGVWYYYITEDNIHYVDRKGNWYELANDNELVWNEVNSNRRLHFTKVEDRIDNRWDTYGNNSNPYHNSNKNRWNNKDYSIGSNSLEGDWYGRNGNNALHIKSFQQGIKVKSKHEGWKKFYAEKSDFRFRDKNGNTIRIIGNDKLRLRNQDSGEEKIFSRNRNFHRRQYS